MSKYIWCEDFGAGFKFWQELFAILDAEIIVQSKKNNTELRKSVEQISLKDKNRYYIFMDMAVDNTDVLRETDRIRKLAKSRDNVYIANIHSFEHALLSFKLLENWLFAKEDELKIKRENLLIAREIFLKMVSEGINKEEYIRIYELTGYNIKKNSEQLAAALLRDITKNTGFETTKSKLGECFIKDCCTWAQRQDDDKCGLNESRLDSVTKRKLIVQSSVLWEAFKEVGLLD